MKCVICNLGIQDESRATPIGNSLFHNDCLSRKRRDAEAQHKLLTFVWQGSFCTEVKMVDVQYRQGAD